MVTLEEISARRAVEIELLGGIAGLLLKSKQYYWPRNIMFGEE